MTPLRVKTSSNLKNLFLTSINALNLYVKKHITLWRNINAGIITVSVEGYLFTRLTAAYYTHTAAGHKVFTGTGGKYRLVN